MEFAEVIAWALQVVYGLVAHWTEGGVGNSVEHSALFDQAWLALRQDPSVPEVCASQQVLDDVHTNFNVIVYVLNTLWDVYVGGDGTRFGYDCW